MTLKLNNTTVNDVYLNRNVGYTIVGSPTIVNGVVSGFSSTDNLEIQSLFNPQASDFKIVIKYKISSIGTLQYLLYLGKDSVTNSQSCINLMTDGKVRLIAKNISSSDVTINNTGFEINKWMWANLERIGTNITFAFSTDGINYIVGKTYTNITNSLSWITTPIIGSSALHNDRYVQGSIDLNHTYIKVNGITWFNGKQAASPALNTLHINGNTVWQR